MEKPLAEKFRELIRHIMLSVAQGQLRPNANRPLLTYIVLYLQRTIIRFDNLIARWKAGKLPKPRKSRAGQGAQKRKTPRFRLPKEFGWLYPHTDIPRLTGPGGPYIGTPYGIAVAELEQLINGPEMAALLAEMPHIARTLRPLRHMLGISTVPVQVGAFIPQPPPPPPPPPVPTIRIDLGGGHYEIRPANSSYKPRIRWGIREI
jgi:hypothetical protein